MKPFILSTTAIFFSTLMSAIPVLAQSQNIDCVRDRDVIDCGNYGSFKYRSNNNINNNNNSATISCLRKRNVIDCPNYGRFKYNSNNNNGNWSNNNYNTQAEINNLYIQVLGRNATTNDLRNYNQAINNQNWSLTQARRNLANSQEFNQAVNNLYQEFLGRNADMNGLQSYRNAVINGRNFAQIKNEITNSPESISRNNNGNFNNDFNQSNEYSSIDKDINNLHVQVLGRNAISNELKNYRKAIKTQGLSLPQARRNLGNSQQFNQAINNIYQEFLGRNTDKNGLQSYRNEVINGRSFEDVRNEIANSPEANNRNNNYNQAGNEPSFEDGVKNMICQSTGLCF